MDVNELLSYLYIAHNYLDGRSTAADTYVLLLIAGLDAHKADAIMESLARWARESRGET